MKIQEIQELFRHVKTTQDYYNVVRKNPEIAEEITTINHYGIRKTSEDVEMSELELENVVGGNDINNPENQTHSLIQSSAVCFL